MQRMIFSRRYGVLTIFKMAVVRHLEFSNFAVMSCDLRYSAILLPYAKIK